MLEEIKKDIYINHDLRYYDLSNIFFDSPLNSKSIEELKDIFFSLNNITQLYFRANIDIESIEKIKYLLEISPTMTDSLVEKFVLEKESDEYKKLIQINFANPNTWYLSLREFNYEYKTVSVDVYREIVKCSSLFLDTLKDKEYSKMERVLLAYDYCKTINYVDENVELVDIFRFKKANNYGFAILFQYLLKEFGIDSFIGEALVENKKYNIVIANIIDDKYTLDGIYLFDPLSDYLSKEEAITEELRNINYNFFGLRISEYEDTIFKDRFIDVLSCLIHDLDYDLEKLKFISPATIKQLEKSFNMPFVEIHERVKNAKGIEDSIKLDMIEFIYKRKTNIIIENYQARKIQIFNNLDINHELK